MNEWKERLKKRYQELKEAGKPFFPDIIFKDTLASFLIFVILVIVALKFEVELEEVADPTDATYNPRPEWYFLFLFQALKFFPGSMESLVAVVIPTFAILFMILLPFIDRGPKRHPLDRPALTSLGVLALLGFVALTVWGIKSPLLNPTVQKDPKVVAGRQLYTDLRCSYCHSINGRGGIAAPDLSTVGARRDREWMVKHFQNPQGMTEGSIMPKLNLLPEEIDNLVAYMQTLGGGGPFTPQAPVLFEQNCSSCHRLDGKGDEVGPDLTTVRSYRDKAFLYGYIEDPKPLNPNSAMPGFKGTLTDAEIEDVARYLMSSQRNQNQ